MSKFRLRAIDVTVLAAMAGGIGLSMSHRAPREQPSDFARGVDMAPFHAVAVHADGRLRSFESHAKTYMGIISGSRSIRGQNDGFTYLDLAIRPELYADAELIYVKNKEVRSQILTAMASHDPIDDWKSNTLQKTGLFPRNWFSSPEVSSLLQKLGQDLIRTAKAVDAVSSALAVSNPRFLLDNLRLIPPPDGRTDSPWLSMNELTGSSAAPSDNVHAGLAQPRSIPGLNPELQGKLSEVWSTLREAWRAGDAGAVNTQLSSLSALLPTVAPSAYPSPGRLAMESWYFRSQSMTWVWLLYLACVVPLLMSVIFHWNGARAVGLILFGIAFAAQTASVGIRWYISGRWPNSNMFEAVTTSAWMGGVLALFLERIARKTALRNLFALGAAIMSMLALMAAYFWPASLDSAINNKMAALNDVWLYIHTNMIIWSYAVIGLACVPALLLLRHRWCVAWDERTIPRWRLIILPPAIGVLQFAGYRLLMHALDDPARELTRQGLLAATGAFWASLMWVFLEGSAAWTRNRGGGRRERSASGGAASLMGAGASSTFLKQEGPTASQVFDGATMVLVELSFIMLWTGIVMGAIWADHSWGRPWGWDPKEVFALNTFLIFLILIHVRLKVRDKGFWTAILAVIGFEVMMFNWIVVNFIISGLHSYA